MPNDIDEIALNVLLAEGVDVPTAIAAAADDRNPPRPESNAPRIAGLIVAVIVGVVVFCLLAK